MPKVKRMQDAFLAESDDLTNGMSRFCFKLSKKLKSYWGKHVLKAPPSKRICKVNTIILRRNYLSRESFVAKFVSSFFPSNPVGPASQLALQVCLHVVSIRCSFNHFQIFQTLDSDNNGFLSFKEFVLGLNVTANGTRYNRKHIHDKLYTYIQTFSERSS